MLNYLKTDNNNNNPIDWVMIIAMIFYFLYLITLFY